MRRDTAGIESVPQQLIEKLQAYYFPGNARELENIIERAVILSTGPTLQMDVSFISPRQAAPAPEELQTLSELFVILASDEICLLCFGHTIAISSQDITRFGEAKRLAYFLRASFPSGTSALIMRSKMNDFALSTGASSRI